MKKYITIHSVAALEARAAISYIVCNIPFSDQKLAEVNELYKDPDVWYIELHDYKH